jgi:hypothetical protein
MSMYRKIQNLRAQIIETEKMLSLVENHPIMSFSLQEKINYLKKQLSELPIDILESKIRLLFSGNAVKGSLGIKSSFVGKTIAPIQELIKTQAAIVRFGNVSKRGQVKRSISTDLYLTSLPIGSFGFELSQLEIKDLFDESEIAKSIKQVISLIESTAKSDEAFEKIIEDTPKRSLNNLHKFFKEASDENSIVKLESGDLFVEISEQKVHEGYDRVSSTLNDEGEIFVNATLRGFLLDSSRFEIIDEKGKGITGLISEHLSEEEIIEYDKKYLNKPCKVHLQTNQTTFKTGNQKTTYELLEITNP